jgi:hypothetical protein
MAPASSTAYVDLSHSGGPRGDDTRVHLRLCGNEVVDTDGQELSRYGGPFEAGPIRNSR